MPNRRRQKPSSPFLALLSVTQLIAGFALLIAGLSYLSRPECGAPAGQASAGVRAAFGAFLAPVRFADPNCTQAATVLPEVVQPPVPLSTATQAPAPVARSSPAATASPVSLINEFIAPFGDEAQRRRTQRAQIDPHFKARMDAALNAARINFLLFGYGETFEPPFGPDFKGSINIYSLDVRSLTLATITLNHDIRAPEVERFRQQTDQKKGPTKIDQSYPVGGFDVMRTTVEDATGFSIDFQLALEDGVIKRAIDELFDGVNVNVPLEFDALPVYFEGVKYPDWHYPPGVQKMDGLHALQYIKAVYEGPHDPNKELTVRKQIVVKAMMDAVKKESLSPLFWTRALSFLRGELDRKAIALDFDPSVVLLQSVQNFMFRAAGGGTLTLPAMEESVYVVDREAGDGGVEWVTGSTNPLVQRELQDGLYVDKSVSVPTGEADPYADDLVTYYWTSVRALIKRKLMP